MCVACTETLDCHTSGKSRCVPICGSPDWLPNIWKCKECPHTWELWAACLGADNVFLGLDSLGECWMDQLCMCYTIAPSAPEGNARFQRGVGLSVSKPSTSQNGLGLLLYADMHIWEIPSSLCKSFMFPSEVCVQSGSAGRHSMSWLVRIRISVFSNTMEKGRRLNTFLTQM